MKKSILIIASMMFLSTSVIFGQDINKSQVPSVVMNSFQQKFSKASDIDWEMEGDLYKVEFEVGMRKLSHDVLIDKTGKIVHHKEEITKGDLPNSVASSIDKDFPGYRTDDIKKITEGDNTIYIVEVKKMDEEWKLTYDSNGKLVNKIAD